MANVKLRSDDKYSGLLSESPGDKHLKIAGCRLPTFEQVLLCFLANLVLIKETTINVVRPRLEAAKAAVAEVLVHYRKARIPTKDDKSMARQVEQLFDELRNTYRQKDEKKEAFKTKLKTTMPFWPRNCIQTMEKSYTLKRNETEKAAWSEDLEFLKSMMGDRKATYSSFDKVSAKNFKRKLEKVVTEKKEEKKPHLERADQTLPQHKDNDHDQDWIPSTSGAALHRRNIKTGVTIHLAPDFINSPLIVSAAVRNRISPVALANVMTALVESCGGDTSAVNLSYSQVNRYMQKSTQDVVTAVVEAWVPPSKALLHWDSKLMRKLDGIGKQERMPVLLSGAGRLKLLGVPVINKSEVKQQKGEEAADTFNFVK